MKNTDQWKPTKYEIHKGQLRGTRERSELRVSSRRLADGYCRWLGPWLKQHCSGRLLDLGCGKAPLYLVYRDHADEVVCADWPSSAHGVQHVDFEIDITQPLPFDDNQFDTLLLTDVLEHIPTPEALWDEMHRVLSPGGKLILTVPYMYGIHEAPHDFHRYTEFALRRFVDQRRMKLLEFEPIGGYLEVIATVFSKSVQQTPVVGGLMAYAAHLKIASLAATGFGRRLLARGARSFPLGYALVAQKSG